MVASNTEVAIVGAGPYGLAMAAHLKFLSIPFRIFGNPMQFWREMPLEMYLKSPASASNIYTPSHFTSLIQHLTAQGLDPEAPCRIAEFAEYGQQMQLRHISEVDQVAVTLIRRDAGKFHLQTDTGDNVEANHVVIAVGLKAFFRLPRELDGISRNFASHTCEHSTFAQFEGKTVFVIGAGQSALQAAALLHESGAHVAVFVRGPNINFSTHTAAKRHFLARLRRPESGLGVGIKNWLIEHFPNAISLAPASWRAKFLKTHLGPSVAWWLADRVTGKFPIHYRHALEAAEATNGRLHLWFRDGLTGAVTETVCDHLIAGTGFDMDIDRLQFLCPALRRQIVRAGRSARLDQVFQSSVPGLHFIGTMSAASFGPLFRFILGARYTARTLAAHFVRVAGPARAASIAPGRADAAGHPEAPGAMHDRA